MFGVTCTCSWLELFVVIWSWVKNDAAPFLGVGGLVGGYGRKTNKIEITTFQKRKPKRLLSIVRTAVLSVYVVFVFDTFILCMTSRSILAAIQI